MRLAVTAPLRRLGSIARGGRPPRSTRPGDAVILMYHRVADLDADPAALAVHPDRFAEQLAALRERFSRRSRCPPSSRRPIEDEPPGSVVVTFDDGYRDNLTSAKPLLERFDVPATVFVVSGYIDSG